MKFRVFHEFLAHQQYPLWTLAGAGYTHPRGLREISHSEIYHREFDLAQNPPRPPVPDFSRWPLRHGACKWLVWGSCRAGLGLLWGSHAPLLGLLWGMDGPLCDSWATPTRPCLGLHALGAKPVPPPPPVLTRALSEHGDPVFPYFRVLFLNHHFCGSNPIENVVCGFGAGCRKSQHGCHSVGVAVLSRALVSRGCVPVCCFIVSCFEGEGWPMSATRVPWYVPRGNTGLSEHGDLVFPHFCLPHPNSARVGT